jgi:hypothetical protein
MRRKTAGPFIKNATERSAADTKPCFNLLVTKLRMDRLTMINSIPWLNSNKYRNGNDVKKSRTTTDTNKDLFGPCTVNVIASAAVTKNEKYTIVQNCAARWKSNDENKAKNASEVGG